MLVFSVKTIFPRPTSLECMRNVAGGGARAYVTEWKVLRCNAFLYLAQRVHFYDG